MRLSEFMLKKKKKLLGLVSSTKDKKIISDVFREISDVVYNTHVSRKILDNQKKNFQRLKDEMRETKKEITKYKQTLKILKIEKFKTK